MITLDKHEYGLHDCGPDTCFGQRVVYGVEKAWMAGYWRVVRIGGLF
ncbi:hypothetical protein LH447_03860 [Laribacter hongkongensis]|nr:hypothetical protein [Laribacter hongkongensis]MCG9052242.1 hypothetical protein [Laribacter hongkongensis]